ncbi:ROK family protein [Homoserinimonas sp. A447]
MTSTLAIGIDVGGTSIKAAAVDAEGRLHAEQRMHTPSADARGDKTARIISGLIDQFCASHQVTSVGVAVPGIVDEESGVVVSAVNLGWEGLHLRQMITRFTPLPLFFGQDVRAGAHAEAALGAARDRNGVVAFVPIGTGIAAGIIVDGIPLTAGGWAGEIGQIAVATTAHREGTPRALESVASASAIARRIGCADAKVAADLVNGGDASAIEVWNDAIDALAESLAWMTAIIGAETIIIGGGLSESGSLLMDPLERALAVRLGALRRPALLTAAFGDQAAIVGAGLLALGLEVDRP